MEVLYQSIFTGKKMRFWHYLKALRTKSSYLKEAQIWGKNELVHFKAHSKIDRHFQQII